MMSPSTTMAIEPGTQTRPPGSDSSTRTSLMGVPIDRLTEQEAIDHILTASMAGRGGWVVTPNVDILRKLVRDASLLSLVGQADLLLVDGAPLVWASRLQGNPLPERIPGATFIWSLSRAAADEGASIFLLGGAPGVAAKAGMVLQGSIAGLRIGGDHSPPLGFETSPEHTEAIVEAIRSANPHFVFCGFGCPKQERLMAKLTKSFPHIWFLATGGSLDFIVGATKRAPVWMQSAGLEWLHRLLHEPRRLFTRYIVHDLPFALRLLATAAVARCRPSRKIPDKQAADLPL